MSEQGIDAYRVASVLGYCLLPMVGVGAISVVMALEYGQAPLCPFYITDKLPVVHSAIFFLLPPFCGVHTLLLASS